MKHLHHAAHAIIALLLAIPVLASAGTQYQFQLPQQSYSFSYARNYTVYKPAGYSGAMPMVMTLHGCQQTENDVLNDWGMKDAADRHGFILVTPFITNYNGLRNENCWGFWFSEHIHEGSGEVEDLHQIARQVEQDFDIDPNRRYISGLSSGGAMTVAAAVAHNEYWAAAASASGLPYGETASSVSFSSCPGSATFRSINLVAQDMQAELNDDYAIPMMALQNIKDCTVVTQAALNIRDSWLQVFAEPGSQTPAAALVSSSACSPFYQNNYSCDHRIYTADGQTGRSVVETIIYDGPRVTANPNDTDRGHYWIGGAAGNEGKWAVRTGPIYPDILWDFFQRHPREESIGGPVITLLGDSPMEVELNDSFTDPGATATDPEEGPLPVTVQCTVDTGTPGTYGCLYQAINSQGISAEKNRVVSVVDPEAILETCLVANESPVGHINQGRAIAGGNFGLRALATGDQIDIGYAYDSWSTVTLTEGLPGEWFSTAPVVCDNNGEVTPPPPPQCQDWNDSNLNHTNQGRAYYLWGYYTQGGNEYLGALSGTLTWVHQSDGGPYRAGQCSANP